MTFTQFTKMILYPLMIGSTEILIILGVAILLFGGKKIPEIMRGLGQGIKSYKDGMKEGFSFEDEKEEKSK